MPRWRAPYTRDTVQGPMTAYHPANPNFEPRPHGMQAGYRTCVWGGVDSVCGHGGGASSRGLNRLLRLGRGLFGGMFSGAALVGTTFVAMWCTKLLNTSSAASVTPSKGV